MKKQINVFYNITKYSIMMFFRDRAAVYFSLFIPLLIMIIFGVLNFGATKTKLGIVDQSSSTLSKQVVETMKKIDVLEVTVGGQDEQIEMLKNSKIDLVLVLPSNFGENVIELKAATATFGSNVQPKIQDIEVYYDQASNTTTTSIGLTVIKSVFDQITHQVANIPNLFALQEKTLATKKLGYIDFLIPGVAAMSVMQMSIFGVVGAIVSWRERGILKRLLATPIRPASILFSQVVTRVIITLAQVSILIAVGVIFFNLNIVGSLLLFFALAFLGGLVFLSMGFAISGIANSQNTVMAVGNLIMMPQMFLSGVFFPRDALPDILGKITAYFPLTYLSDGMREVMIRGAGVGDIQGEILGLVVWVIVMFFVATRLFRWE